jgi:hypothetical protein
MLELLKRVTDAECIVCARRHIDAPLARRSSRASLSQANRRP